VVTGTVFVPPQRQLLVIGPVFSAHPKLVI
jgi:hypothetical protein